MNELRTVLKSEDSIVRRKTIVKLYNQEQLDIIYEHLRNFRSSVSLKGDFQFFAEFINEKSDKEIDTFFEYIRKYNDHTYLSSWLLGKLADLQNKHIQEIVEQRLESNTAPSIKIRILSEIDLSNNSSFLPKFIEFLDCDDKYSRTLAINKLAGFNDKRILEPLIRSLRHNEFNPNISGYCDILRSFGDEAIDTLMKVDEIINRLIEVDAKSKRVITMNVCRILGELEATESIDFLTKKLKDSDMRWGVGKVAVEALSKIEDTKATKMIVEHCSTELKNGTASIDILNAMERSVTNSEYRHKDFSNILVQYIRNCEKDWSKKKAFMMLKQIDEEEADSILEELVLDDNFPVTKEAASMIIAKKEEKNFEKILELYNESGVDKFKFINPLGNCEDERAAEILYELLKDKDVSWRDTEIIRALGRLGGKRAVEIILDFCKSKNYIGLACLQALIQTKSERVFETIIDSLYSTSDEVRKEAILGVQQLNISKAKPFLEDILKTNIPEDLEILIKTTLSKL